MYKIVKRCVRETGKNEVKWWRTNSSEAEPIGALIGQNNSESSFSWLNNKSIGKHARGMC